jgi:gliding motility-associated-like protein
MKTLSAFIFVLSCTILNAQVVINEVMVMPGTNYSATGGGDNTNAAIQGMYYYSNSVYGGSEWVELYNTDPCAPVDIGCWMLGANCGPGATGEGAFIFPQGTIIPPGGFIVVGGANASGVTIVFDNANLINNYSCDGSGSTVRWHLYNGRGYLALYDNNLNITDAIYWSPSAADLNNQDEFDNVGGCIPWVQACNHDPMFVAPMAKSITGITYVGDCSSSAVGSQYIGKTVGRTADGGGSWSVGMNPTPGAANCPSCPPVAGAFTINANVMQPDCGSNNGSIIIQVPNAGTPPYQYSIDNGSNFQNNGSFTPLGPGTYSIVVKDNLGCESDTTITLANSASFSYTISLTNTSCGNANGSISLTITSGGTNPIQFSNNGGSSFQPTSTFSGLSAGSYHLVIKDAQGCQRDTTVQLTNTSGPVLTISAIDASCGNNNGQASVIANGAVAPISYSWSSGQQSQNISNLAPGLYTVTVNDGSGCTTTANVQVSMITGPTLTATTVDASCNLSNGSATVTAVGGSGTYSYQWNTSPPQNTATATGLSTGTYTVNVVDGGPCPASITINIQQSGAPQISSSAEPEKCLLQNGTASVTAIGGSGSYSYQWNTNPPQNAATASGLAAGVYQVTVSDGSCTSVISVTVPAILPPTLQLSSTAAHCYQSDGSAAVIASGGTGTYTYIWNTQPVQQGQIISNVSPGSYSVTVNDGNCTVSATTTIENIPGPVADIYYSPRNPDVFNPLVVFESTAVGNIADYQWSFGDGNNGSGAEVSHNYNSPGDYSVFLIVTDNYGCSDTAKVVITINDITTVYMPNAFSPNSDGNNDTFGPSGTNIMPDYRFIIFSRWGEEVFFTTDYENRWDGTINNSGVYAHEGVYVYRIEYTSLDKGTQTITGHVTLLR